MKAKCKMCILALPRGSIGTRNMTISKFFYREALLDLEEFQALDFNSEARN